MTGRWGWPAAHVAAVASVASGVSVLWLAVRTPELAQDRAGSATNALFVVGMLGLTAAGFLLVRHGGHRRMGWLLLGSGLANVLGRLVLAAAVAGRASDHALVDALAWMTNWAWVPGQVLAVLLILRFPDGRAPGRFWIAVERVVVGWGVLTIVCTALVPGPLGAEPLAMRSNPWGLTALEDQLDVALAVLFTVQPLLVALAVAATVMRWRGAGAAERDQLQAVAFALAFVAVTSGLAVISGAGAVAEGLAWLVLPSVIAYAVARHDLWDIDSRQRLDRLRRVRDEERTRLQRDLHDSLGPSLGSITMRVEAARNLLGRGAPHDEIDRVLASIGSEAATAVEEVRRFIDELGPSALADSDLSAALRRAVSGYADAGMPVTLRVPEELPALDAAAEAALFRVAGEALRNVARHAGASRCTVALRVEDDDVVLEVRDDGVGLRDQPAGVGRRAMAARIAALGGAFSLAEQPRGGVLLTARVTGGSR